MSGSRPASSLPPDPRASYLRSRLPCFGAAGQSGAGYQCRGRAGLYRDPPATAYSISKRGLVAYSDALRLAHGDAITVTTVYPGYIRTPLHDAAAAEGLSLEGAVPAERLEDATRVILRAAFGRPARDLATSSWASVAHQVLRLAPRGLVDRAVRSTLVRRGLAGARRHQGRGWPRTVKLPILPCQGRRFRLRPAE